MFCDSANTTHKTKPKEPRNKSRADQKSDSSAQSSKNAELRRSSSVTGELGADNADARQHFQRTASYESVLHDENTGMNNLAQNALLAAQVLHLIPTKAVKQRNFLQGCIATNSLLGADELERVCPNRQLSVFVGTWNMNGQNPPRDLDEFVLPNGLEHLPDLLAFGTQESCSDRSEWEVSLQETLGPTHVLFHSAYLGTLHLAVFLRRDLIWYCSLAEDASFSVRPGTAFKTKGAVAVAFVLFGTSFLFITAHLTAHQEKVKERVSDIRKITHALDLPKAFPVKNKSKDVTQNFDCAFWCGDLNFRLSHPRDKILEWIGRTSFPLPAHLPHGYMHVDQLKLVLSEGAALRGFCEANITFPPTYKYDPGTHQFDTSAKQRTPAYTDRILYKARAPKARGSLTAPIECIAYSSAAGICSSDHKPVWGLYAVQLRPGLDTMPLAAGLFNREVYLEGMKRRAAHYQMSKASAVCNLQ